MSQVKTKDVTQFFKDMVDTSINFEVDDGGYVINKITGDRVFVGDEGNRSPILLYQEEIKDQGASILNPLAEGLGEPPTTKWFFRTLRAALLGRVTSICQFVIAAALAEKQRHGKADKEENASHLPMELLKLASLIIDDVDDKVAGELEQLVPDIDTSEFFVLYYQKNHLRWIARSGLFDTDTTGTASFRSKYPKVRKKTWVMLERLLLGIFGLKSGDEITKFSRKATELSCVRLSSFLNVLLGVYQEINPLLAAIDSDLPIDLSKLVYHVNQLTAYADNARYMTQIQRSAPVNAAPLIPGPAPFIPQPGAIPGYSPPGPVQGVLIPGPQLADGRQLPPTSMVPGPYGGGYGAPQGYGYQPQQQQQQPQGYNYSTPPFNPPYQQASTYFGPNGIPTGNLMPNAPLLPRW